MDGPLHPSAKYWKMEIRPVKHCRGRAGWGGCCPEADLGSCLLSFRIPHDQVGDDRGGRHL